MGRPLAAVRLGAAFLAAARLGRPFAAVLRFVAMSLEGEGQTRERPSSVAPGCEPAEAGEPEALGGARSTSLCAAPAGIIGKQFSSRTTPAVQESGAGMIQEGEDRIVQLFRLLHLEPLDPECLRQSSEVGQGGAVALGVALVVDELLPLAHHPHPLVVEDEDLDGELVLGGGGELLDVHHDRGLASDIHDEGPGMGGLDADGGGEAVAHRPQSAGGHPPVGLVETDVLGGPHLVLADLAGEVGVPALRERIQAHDRMLRLDRARGGLAVGEAIPSAPRGDLPPPACEGLLLGGEAALLPAALKGGKRIASVSDDAHIHEDVLVDAARINVDVDLARIGGEGGGLACHPIVKARPNAEHRVRTVHGEIGLIRAVHPDHPEEERVVGGEGPEPHEGAGDGKAQLAREGGEAAGGMGPRVDHPAAEIDDRPLGAAQDIKGGVYGVRVGAQAREARGGGQRRPRAGGRGRSPAGHPWADPRAPGPDARWRRRRRPRGGRAAGRRHRARDSCAWCKPG